MNRNITHLNPARTLFQTNVPYSPETDLRTEGVIIYMHDYHAGPGELKKRAADWKEHGYKVYAMISISHDYRGIYVRGDFDGKRHLDEVQTDPDGRMLMIGMDAYYMVPTEGWQRYLEALCEAAIDAGVEGVFPEEPEFWTRAVYENEAAKATAYLDCADRLSRFVKRVAAERGRRILFLLPEHSLLNYATWQIVSPNGAFAQLEAVDGFIAQVWTGTARSPRPRAGGMRERIFESAFLEYSWFSNLCTMTGKLLYLLTDPVEDAIDYSTSQNWEDYRNWYNETLAAALLNDGNSGFEVMPWPQRVFRGRLRSGVWNTESFDFCLGRFLARTGSNPDEERPVIEALETFFESHYGRPVSFGDFLIDLARRFVDDTSRGDIEVWKAYSRIINDFYEFATGGGDVCPQEYLTELLSLFAVQSALTADTDTSDAESAADTGDTGGPPRRDKIGLLTGDSLSHFPDAVPHSSVPLFTRNIPTAKNRLAGIFGPALPLLEHGLRVEMLPEEGMNGAHAHDVLRGFDTIVYCPAGWFPRSEALAERLRTWLAEGGELLVTADNPPRPIPAGLQNLIGKEGPVGAGRVTRLAFEGAALAEMPDEENPLLSRFRDDTHSFLRKRGNFAICNPALKPVQLSGRWLMLNSHELPVLENPRIETGHSAILLDIDSLVAAKNVAETQALPAWVAGRVLPEATVVSGDSVSFVAEGPMSTTGAARVLVTPGQWRAQARDTKSGETVDCGTRRDKGSVLVTWPHRPWGTNITVTKTGE